MAVKKLFLAGVAALLLATGTAHTRLAQADAIELPNDMLGYWCFSHATTDDDPDQEASVLEQAKNFDDCGNHGGIHLRKGRGYQLGRFDWRANCKISAIEVVSKNPKPIGYLAIAEPMAKCLWVTRQKELKFSNCGDLKQDCA